ncbi:DUF6498-containing protein [Halogeometricum limi]|uniref:Uncharacterized protein n=1 Tax=Halogeometricum limi TaxID=555875 RepID=A0A1I6HFM9_9EURY|nr:DUF6498-containing protein [Halogeometricum limi]SFR53077.1 hypothetical protein SAMN04488124_2166 [Halogeometricum limi]
MSLRRNDGVGTLAFAPTLLSNLLPLVGVVALDWRVVEVLTIYWLELGTTFLVYGVAALFARRPVVLDGRNLHLPGVSRDTDRRGKWERDPSSVALPGPLPPVYPRNLRLVRMSLIWGFGFLALPLFGNWGLVGDVLSPALALTALAMVASHLDQLRREYFGEKQYEEMSAHMVLEIPGRLLFFAACYLALVGSAGIVLALFAVGVDDSNTVLLTAFEAELAVVTVVVFGMLFVEWSRFRAEHDPDPSGLATWFLPENPRE